MARAPRKSSRPPAYLRHASLDGRPVRYRRDPQEAWILDRAWRQIPYAELYGAQLMLRRDFDQRFGTLQALPKDAFRGLPDATSK